MQIKVCHSDIDICVWPRFGRTTDINHRSFNSGDHTECHTEWHLLYCFISFLYSNKTTLHKCFITTNAPFYELLNLFIFSKVHLNSAANCCFVFCFFLLKPHPHPPPHISLQWSFILLLMKINKTCYRIFSGYLSFYFPIMQSKLLYSF